MHFLPLYALDTAVGTHFAIRECLHSCSPNKRCFASVVNEDIASETSSVSDNILCER